MARWRLLAEILLAAAVILTKPDGTPIWIAESQAVAVFAMKNVGAAETAVVTLNGTFFVREAPDVVAKKFGWTQ